MLHHTHCGSVWYLEIRVCAVLDSDGTKQPAFVTVCNRCRWTTTNWHLTSSSSNKNNDCIIISFSFLFYSECPVGYTGMNCIYKCNYPSYGEDCAKSCKDQCPQEQCDHVFGCSHTTQAGKQLKRFISMWYYIENDFIFRT